MHPASQSSSADEQRIRAGADASAAQLHPAVPTAPVPETGGPPGPEPTRYGDWERKGRCIDF